MNVEPRIELEDEPAARLEASPAATVPIDDVTPAWGTAALTLSGAVVLGVGLAGLSVGNFVADQFARAPWLGWATLSIAGAGFGLLGAGVWRELRALLALQRVDNLRAGLASSDATRIMDAARAWSRMVPGGALVEPALQTVNDPDAAIALLRAGPAETLQDAADRLGRIAAIQAVAGIAAMPSPALDVLFVGWRGIRLVRQVAALYGVRPGVLATFGLLRRTAVAATMVGAANLAGNTAARAVLSHPLLAHALGDAAAAGVAARRLLVLARATSAACDPLPPA
jgi:putative membrane protein